MIRHLSDNMKDVTILEDQLLDYVSNATSMQNNATSCCLQLNVQAFDRLVEAGSVANDCAIAPLLAVNVSVSFISQYVACS